MRRSLTLASLAGLLLAMVPGAAGAVAPTRFAEDAVYISCDLPTDDGFVSMFAIDSTGFGEFGDLVFWATGAEPFQDDPTLVSTESSVDGDDDGLTATFALAAYDSTADPPFGAPAGDATLTATFSPDGDPITVDERHRFGNRWETVTGTEQPLVATGTLTLPGMDPMDLGGCSAVAQHLTFWSTDPAAFHERFSQFSVSCQWESTDSFVALFMNADPFSAFGDVYVSSPDSEVGGSAEGTLTETELGLAVVLEDQSTGVVVGSAEAAATMASTGTTTRTMFRDGRRFEKVVSKLFSVDGTLEVTLGASTTSYPVDDDHCFAADETYHAKSVRPNGPKPGPLANDDPDGATALRLGRTARIVTGGNAFEPEATCIVSFPDGDSEIPLGYTAWWTVTGTGAEMTADTAGSEFDTVLGVYTMGTGGLEQVVCVDDIVEPDFSLQARASWDSTAGTTYYIQAGGYGGDSGRLQLIVR